MHIERMKLLVEGLRDVPPMLFSMRHYERNGCRCAAGWAVEMPALQAQGLQWGSFMGDRFPAWRGNRTFRALGAFFELELPQALEFFGSHERTLQEEIALLESAIAIEEAHRARLPGHIYLPAEELV